MAPNEREGAIDRLLMIRSGPVTDMLVKGGHVEGGAFIFANDWIAPWGCYIIRALIIV